MLQYSLNLGSTNAQKETPPQQTSFSRLMGVPTSVSGKSWQEKLEVAFPRRRTSGLPTY